MTKCKVTYEVVIIGGGPAGIAASLVLSARNVEHCIVDADLEARRKLGEAIPPNAKPLLEKLGLMELLENERHMPYYGNKSSWGNASWEQKEFIKDVYGHGFLLDRQFFEQQLREKLNPKKSMCFWGYKLRSLESNDESVCVEIENGEDTFEINGKMIIDATGRKSSVCRFLNVKKEVLDKQFGIVIRATLTTEIQREIYIEATENGWWYAAPNGNQEIILMFFTIQSLIPAKSEITSFLAVEFERTTRMQELLFDATIFFEEIQIRPTGTSRLIQPYGKSWVAIGDAAYSFDPISSYGITSALAAGFYGANAVVSHLAGEQDAFITYQYLMENAFDGYYERLYLHYRAENRWPDSPYWKTKQM